MVNDYLNKLLALQQDGNQAISAPYNWVNERPLLEVDTEIDLYVDDLYKNLISDNRTAGIWCFLIGTPGNGKSAGVGKLARILSDNGCTILDEERTPIDQLTADKIPYILNVHVRGNPYPTAQIIQDASVVRDPYNNESEPSYELLLSLDEAWRRGISIIICTNRGVLEKAYWTYYKDPHFSDKKWFPLIKGLIFHESGVDSQGTLDFTLNFDAKKRVYDKAKVSFCQLDNRSLVIGSSTFSKLISKAINIDNWGNCFDCQYAHVCPFYNNRKWLCNESGNSNFIKIVTRAEVFSGQAIVLREAVALISFILAGCPGDYNGLHPCHWVQNSAQKKDYVALAVRRIYMSLFASNKTIGLENDPSLRRRQLASLKRISIRMKQDQMIDFGNQLDVAVSGNYPSRDVGLIRLLGSDGAFPQIGIAYEPLSLDFINQWDSGFSSVLSYESPLICELDKILIMFFSDLENYIESISDYESNDMNWALVRWSSTFLLNLGSAIEGKTAWMTELDEYIKILKLVNKKSNLLTDEEIICINDFQGSIDLLVNKISDGEGNQKVVKITDNISIRGNWVNEKVRPCIKRGTNNGLKIGITFSGGSIDEQAQAYINSQIYLWLKYHDVSQLDIRCFPQGLLRGILDARSRAVSKGKYAFNNDIELIINSTGETIRRVDDIISIKTM